MRIDDAHGSCPPRLRRQAADQRLPVRDLIAVAKRLDINISRACEKGLEEQFARTRLERWREENEAAIQGSNRWVESNGLPLARYRRFHECSICC